jgi:hypothetical protein
MFGTSETCIGNQMRTSYFGEDGVTSIACGEIDSLPGCSQVAVFHSAFVLPEFRNKGHGLAAHIDRLETAMDLLYDVGLCTVARNNEYQITNLTKTGWKQVWKFVSSKTGNEVLVFLRNLNHVASEVK